MHTVLHNPQLTFSNHLGNIEGHAALLHRLRALAYCVTDRQGHFLEVNDRYCQLYGYTEAELVGQHFSMVVPKDYRSFASELHDSFIAGMAEMPMEWVVQNKAGALIRIYAEAVRIADNSGNVQKLTMIEEL